MILLLLLLLLAGVQLEIDRIGTEAFSPACTCVLFGRAVNCVRHSYCYSVDADSKFGLTPAVRLILLLCFQGGTGCPMLPGSTN